MECHVECREIHHCVVSFLCTQSTKLGGSYGIVDFSRDLTVFSGELTMELSKYLTQFWGEILEFLGDLTEFSGDLTEFSGDLTEFSGELTELPWSLTEFLGECELLMPGTFRNGLGTLQMKNSSIPFGTERRGMGFLEPPA